MAIIPPAVAESPLSHLILKAGLIRAHQGKVRDTYELPDDKDHLLFVTTDRVSIFDFVLNGLVQDKGAILNALTMFWSYYLPQDMYNHITTHGMGIDRYLPKDLCNNPELQARALIVKKHKVIPVECIVRGYLTGSGWQSYQQNSHICGVKLPSGLHNGSKLPEPIFTPTTKASEGHDEPLAADEVMQQYGPWIRDTSISCYKRVAYYASQHGLILVDTKLEFSSDDRHTLVDEICTPDSSRFWDLEKWRSAQANGGLPPSLDKQFIRNWGTDIDTPAGKGIGSLDPSDGQHTDFVNALEVPTSVLSATSDIYHTVFQRLTSQNLLTFQSQNVGITDNS